MATWTLHPYNLALFGTAAISAALAVYAWRGRQKNGAAAVALLMSGAAMWSLGYAIALGSGDLAFRILLAKIQHLGIALVSPGMLIFAVQYAGFDRLLSRRALILLWLFPVLDILLAWSNEAHGLVWAKLAVDSSGPVPVLIIGYGWFFWLYTIYTYLLLLVSLLLIGRAFAASSSLRRGQTGAILAGAIAPWLGNLLYLSGASPFPGLDLTPFGYCASGLAITWGLFRYRFLSVVPIARDKVVDHMEDAFIVLDDEYRFVDLNAPAQALIGLSAREAYGRPAAEIFRPWQALVDRFRDGREGQLEVTLGANRTYDLRVSHLTNRQGRVIGRLILLRDITDRKRASAAERAAAQREMQLAQNIQASLLPPSAPAIPGLDIAGMSLPTHDVGGDLFNYYDLPVSEYNPRPAYALAIGDVSGNGVPAALYMAASTIMLSAKAPFVPDVAQLLGEMNVALYPYLSPHRMNLALCYVRLQPAADGGFSAQIGNAGMIAPLLRRSDRCEFVDVGGLPLGAVQANGAYAVIDIRLQPGDTLVLCSDGVVEAMNATRQLYGFDRLCARVAAGPADAHALMHWIIADVQSFAADGVHDDMTLLVARVVPPANGARPEIPIPHS